MICILRLLKMINKKMNLRSDFDILDKLVILKAMKRRLLTMTIIIIIIMTATTIAMLQQ